MRFRPTRLFRTPAIAALVMAALFGLLVAPVAGIAAGPLGKGSAITICTDRGLTQIILDTGGAPASPVQGKSHHGPVCQLCVLHADGPFLPLHAFEMAARFASGGAPALAVAAVVVPRRLFLSGRPTRAPPLAIV